jgi:hypothetical protein
MGPVPRVATSSGAAVRAPSVVPAGTIYEPVAIAEPVEAVVDHQAAAEATVAETFVDEGIVVVHRAPAKAARKDPSHTDEMRTLSKAILDAGRETRRLPLTLAVIILVIVATLTMSLLLSRPNHIGDGITQHSVPAAAPTRA